MQNEKVTGIFFTHIHKMKNELKEIFSNSLTVEDSL